MKQRARHPLQLGTDHAVEVTSLDPQGAASQAGVREGDLIVAINAEAVAHVDDLYRFLSEWPPGKTLTLLRRANKVQLEVRPADAGNGA